MGEVILFTNIVRSTKGKNMCMELITSIRKKSNGISDMPDRARDVIQYFGVKYDNGGVPIIEILLGLGFKIYQKALQPENLSAYIAVDPRLEEKFGTSRITCVNQNDSIGHKRFALAHELAHYLFDYDENVVTYYNTYMTNEIEQDEVELRANAFAANILMPATEFMEVFDSCKDKMKVDTISYLSSYFQVSSTAVIKRMKELGITGYSY